MVKFKNKQRFWIYYLALFEKWGAFFSRVAILILKCGIYLYQCIFSRFSAPACRYVPTCSEYAQQALTRYGLLRGGWLSVRRIARCHPFSSSGYDPLP